MVNVEFNGVIDLLRKFPDEESCIQYLAQKRWGSEPVCQHCGEKGAYYLKSVKRFKCRTCRKQYSVRINTIFHDSNLPLQTWFLAIYLITSHKKGISSLQLARDLDVTQKTAWFMLHRIREAFGLDTPEQLEDTVEMDETYIGGKEKNKPFHKRTEGTQGRSLKTKTPVIGAVQRGGKVIAYKETSTNAEAVRNLAINHISANATVYTDEYKSYHSLNRLFDHSHVKHNAGQYVVGKVHTNTIEGFWSMLKRGIVGIYHFVTEKHLQAYVDEFAFRYNSRDVSDSNRFGNLLGNCETRLSYAQLIG
jgi:transposase-like protein